MSKKVIADVIGALAGSAEYGLHRQSNSSDVYPIDLDFTLDNEPYYYEPKDPQGLPMRQYQSVGLQYNPTRIAAYGFAHFNRYRASGDSESRQIFLGVADWFMRSDDAVWRYNFNWSGLQAPWLSCMAQGEGISVLVRAYRLTGNERYLQQAILAALPFSRPIARGGVRSLISGRWNFLEEYPLETPQHTLNGFLYALIGILDLIDVKPDMRASTGFDELCETLERNWRKWDLGYWSAYDLHQTRTGLRNPATVAYHRLHITQMTYLCDRLKNSAFAECCNVWGSYYNSSIKRLRALVSKVVYRLKEPGSR